MEELVEACYCRGREKIEFLRRADRKLERMRMLLRLAHRRCFLAHNSFEYAGHQLVEAGKMLGGWIKEREGKL